MTKQGLLLLLLISSSLSVLTQKAVESSTTTTTTKRGNPGEDNDLEDIGKIVDAAGFTDEDTNALESKINDDYVSKHDDNVGEESDLDADGPRAELDEDEDLVSEDSDESSSNSTSDSSSLNETESLEKAFLPEEGSAEQEHTNSLSIFFVLSTLVLCIFLVHFILQVKFHYLPESVVIVFLGAMIGLGVHLMPREDFKKVESFSPTIFFLILLPPIIFESGYSLHKGNFFANIGSILLFAVVGTTISAFIVGGGVFLLGLADVVYPLNFVQSFAFGSLISAVDPVATLAIFQALDIDPVLNMLVFGESILNDAVAIVLTTTVLESDTAAMKALSSFQQLSYGIKRFALVFLGSAGIGTLVGFISALVLKHVDLYNNPSLELALMLCFVYSPYALAEGIHLSGIMSILFAAIVMSQYTHHNLSPVTQITMQQTMKTLAFVSETCVFVYLGLALFSFPLIIQPALIIWSIIFILIGRAANIYPLSALCNKFRQHKISKRMMFIMWFSGLRGAIAYALSLHLEFEAADVRKVLVTTTLFVVLFTTVCLGGGTMPMLKILDNFDFGSQQNDGNRRRRGKRSKRINLSKTQEMDSKGVQSDPYLSTELTEEESNEVSTFNFGERSVQLKGFLYYDIKYIRPFLIRRFTSKELREGRSRVTQLTDQWSKAIAHQSDPLMLSDSSSDDNENNRENSSTNNSNNGFMRIPLSQ